MSPPQMPAWPHCKLQRLFVSLMRHTLPLPNAPIPKKKITGEFCDPQTSLPSGGDVCFNNAFPNPPFQIASVSRPPKQTLGFNPTIQSPGVNSVLTQDNSTALTPTIVKTPGVLISPPKSSSNGILGSAAFANRHPSFHVPDFLTPIAAFCSGRLFPPWHSTSFGIMRSDLCAPVGPGVYADAILDIYTAVTVWGLPNFIGAKCPLPSNFKFDHWNLLARTDADRETIACLKYRFLANYQGPVQPLQVTTTLWPHISPQTSENILTVRLEMDQCLAHSVNTPSLPGA